MNRVKQLKQQARNVLIMAALGGMPDTYWQTDRRIASACEVLGWKPEQAREWARNEVDR